MSTPKAAFTFDTTRVYLTSRDNAAPGSGTWAAPTTIFDGVTKPTFASFTTMSAGALDESEDFGILATSLSGLSYLGNGSPDTPHYVTFSGQAGTPFSSDYWDISQGGWTYGGAKWAAVEDGTKIQIIKSTDSGATWVSVDSAHRPDIANNNAAIQRIDSKIYIFGVDNSTGQNWAVYSFDMSNAGGKWDGILTSTFNAPLTINGLNDWSGGLFKFPNGDFGVVYTHSGVGLVYNEYSSGAWSGEITVPGGALANAVIDPGFGKIWVFGYVGNSRLDAVHVSTVAHGGTVTPNIFIIPATVGTGSNDGMGHPSIQNGMIFAPRDDSADHANSVWVALLSDGQFVKEKLPVPSEALNSISNATLNAGGTGYAPGDTGLISGTTNPGTYQILTVGGGGAVTSFFINTGGGGYSISSGIATTTGGLQPGSGTGFKVNITALIALPIPTCSYMMFPNGYSLPTLSAVCPVNNTAQVGVPYSGQLQASGGTPPYTWKLIG